MFGGGYSGGGCWDWRSGVATILVVIAFFIFASRLTVRAGAVVLTAFLVLCLSMGIARARDDGRYAQSPLKQWFDELRSGKGPCCVPRLLDHQQVGNALIFTTR
jgi:hypothetical protein